MENEEKYLFKLIDECKLIESKDFYIESSDFYMISRYNVFSNKKFLFSVTKHYVTAYKIYYTFNCLKIKNIEQAIELIENRKLVNYRQDRIKQLYEI